MLDGNWLLVLPRHGRAADSKAPHGKEMLKYFQVNYILQSGPLDIEIISEGLMVMLRQLSYAIKNQLKAPKAPY